MSRNISELRSITGK